MPKVVITRSWPDDEGSDDLQVIVEVERAYPDELAEAARTALSTFAEAHGVVLMAEKDDE